MNELATLWLPILLSSIAVFFASFLAWVVIGHHTPDWSEIPDEGETLDFIRAQGLRPGQYLFPLARTKEAMADETKQQRMTSGPWGTLNVWSRQVNMGRNLLQTFVFYLVTSFFIGYLATLALDEGATFSKVFQVTGTAGILAYAFGHVPNAIWFGTHRRPMLMDVLDGVCFGLITGLVFPLSGHKFIMPVFDFRFTVNAPVEAAAAFHFQTGILKALTPPLMVMQVHRFDPLANGSIGEFTMWMGPIPVRWRAEHSDVSPNGFTDTQTAGPMKFWKHTHRFNRISSTITEVHEHIEFLHHTGWRGLWSRLLFPRPALIALFTYRRWATRRAQ